MALTVEQELALAGRAWSWLTTVAATNQPRDASRDRRSEGIVLVDARDHYQHLSAVHMVVLGLDHVDGCLRLMSAHWPDEFPAEQADAFCTAWKPLQDLRDLLEHEEDYIAGSGRKPGLLGDLRGWVRGRHGVKVPSFGTAHHLDAKGQLVGLTVLGRDYDLSAALAAGRALRGPLWNFLTDRIVDEPEAGSRKLEGWGYVFNAEDRPITLPNGDIVEPGAMYSEGTVIADPLPPSIALFERPDRWNPSLERWDPVVRRFVPLA